VPSGADAAIVATANDVATALTAVEFDHSAAGIGDPGWRDGAWRAISSRSSAAPGGIANSGPQRLVDRLEGLLDDPPPLCLTHCSGTSPTFLVSKIFINFSETSGRSRQPGHIGL
jgi:hypothetical protein